MAAELSGVPPDLAQQWLTEGRRLIDLERTSGRRPDLATAGYRQLCVELAQKWDAARAGTIAVLRGAMLSHAKKDPRACVQMLTALEREYAARAPETADLAEAFNPLELEARREGGGRIARLTHTAADGSRTTAEVATTDEFEHRSDEELEHFTRHGLWPEEMPRAPVDAIDTEGQEADDTDDAGDDEGGEVSLELADELGAELGAELAEAPPAVGQRAAPAPPPGPLARINPMGPLRPLEDGDLVEAAPEPPARTPAAQRAPAGPEYPPLRRIDPLASR